MNDQILHKEVVVISDLQFYIVVMNYRVFISSAPMQAYELQGSSVACIIHFELICLLFKSDFELMCLLFESY